MTTDLKAGDVVLGYPSSIAPNGFGAKVISVTKQNQSLKVAYKAVSLVDIFLNINKTFTITWGTIEGHPEFKFPVKQKIVSGGIEVEREVSGTAKADINYEVSTQFEFVLEDGVWKKIRIESFLNMKQHKTEIEVEGSVSFIIKKNIICQNLPIQVLPLGELPIFIRPVVKLDASVELSGSAKIKSEQEFSYILSSGHLYDGKNWSSIAKNIEKKPDVTEKVGELAGKLQVGVEGSIVGYFYQFFPVDCEEESSLELSVGLSAKAYLGIKGQCSTKEGLTVNTYVGAKAAVGLKAKLFDIEANPAASLAGDELRWSNKSGHGKCLTSQSRERTKKHQIGFPTEV